MTYKRSSGGSSRRKEKGKCPPTPLEADLEQCRRILLTHFGPGISVLSVSQNYTSEQRSPYSFTRDTASDSADPGESADGLFP